MRTNKAQRELLTAQARAISFERKNKKAYEPKPKCIGNGLKRIERQQREPLMFKGINGVKYLPKNMIDRNYKCVISKVVNDNHGKPEFEHLCFNWVVEY
jgi:hypothetical protein